MHTGSFRSTATSTARSEKLVPLVVDLDGSLLRTDTLIESVFSLARTDPLKLVAMPLWLVHGRASLKQRLARAIELDISTMPVAEDLLSYLVAQKRQGRYLVLATAADQHVAAAVARRFGLFDQVFASDGNTNLSGAFKRDRLVAEFGSHGFDYVGDSEQDLAVWAEARSALLVRPSRRLRERVAALVDVVQTFDKGRPSAGDYLHAIRISHWLKNLLVLLPLLGVHVLATGVVVQAVIAFLAFSLAASGIYLLNDLFDLQSDRRHPHKRLRALASGRIPLLHGLLLVPAVWGCALWLASSSTSPLTWVLICYMVLMVVYSMRLKHVAYLDAAVLGFGYSLRLWAGALAVKTLPSPGLMACCMVYFFGLALLKRYAELVALGHRVAVEGRVRAYPLLARRQLWLTGIVASVGPLCLLLGFPLHFGISARVGTVCAGLVSLLWTAHMWHMAGTGRIAEDPVAYAARDTVSRVLALTGAVLLAAA